MRGTMIYGPGDIRVEDRPDPVIEAPTDAILDIAVACVCGSDLWHYRGLHRRTDVRPMGHEYVGYVREVGTAVSTVKPGDLVVGSFVISDGECEICADGYQSACVNREGVREAQAEQLRVPYADGTLVKVPGDPDPELFPSLLACSDVFGTGWFGADAAGAGPGKTVAVVGDGAVGLSAVLAARCMGAERIIAMSRHADRQRLAREFGATDIVEARGTEGAAAVRELTGGYGAHCVVECVGTGEAMQQAVASARSGGSVGYVGLPHGVELGPDELFGPMLHFHGGPAPVRRYLPDLIDRVLRREVEPGRVFTDEFALEDIAQAYKAMDERRTIKALIRP